MALTSTSAKLPRYNEENIEQQAKGLYLAITSAGDVSDPAARTASVWLRIKETTVSHWGMGVTERSSLPTLMGTRQSICHYTIV